MVSRNGEGKPSAVQTFRKKGRVTIAGILSDELAKGTLNSILKQAGLKEKKR